MVIFLYLPLVLLKHSNNPTRKTGISASDFLLLFLVGVLFLKSVQIFLEDIFWRSIKLLNLAGRAVKYGALNGLIIGHVLPVRCNEGFYLIIYELNVLQIPDQIHHCTHAQLVLFFHAKALSATN